MGEDELVAERVRGYPCLYDKIYRGHKEKNITESAWKKVAQELDFIDDDKHSGFFLYLVLFLLFMSVFFFYFCTLLSFKSKYT